METAFIIQVHISLSYEQGQAPEGVGRGKIILAPLRYFSPPNLAQSRQEATLHVRNRNTGSKSRFMSNPIKNKKYENRSKPNRN